MLEFEVTVQNRTGLHARPAAKLVELAERYKSDVILLVGDKALNAKSILSVLSGGISSGMQITLRLDGSDEREAMEAVKDYFKNLPD